MDLKQNRTMLKRYNMTKITNSTLFKRLNEITILFRDHKRLIDEIELV
jgi:hypothetical protein